MIFYFSGLGNTRYAAEFISDMLDETLSFIPHTSASETRFKGESLGFLFPVYSWGVPPLVIDFINHLSDEFIDKVKRRNTPVWTVMTCGDETGKAPEMLADLLRRRGLELSAAWSVIMPNTYVLLPGFNVDNNKTETAKLDAVGPRLLEIGERIRKKQWIIDVHHGSMAGFKTGVLFPIFKKWGIYPKRWHWTQECIECGKCAKSCPVGNITMIGSHPKWGNKCISCLACYHNCPTHAVEYGGITEHKGQYVCPLHVYHQKKG